MKLLVSNLVHMKHVKARSTWKDTQFNNSQSRNPMYIKKAPHGLQFMVINLNPYSTSIAYRELISSVDPKGHLLLRYLDVLHVLYWSRVWLEHMML